MALSYPLTLPTTNTPVNVSVAEVNLIGVDISPFTLEQQVQELQGQGWEINLDYPPLEQADAEALISGLLSALHGSYGTFLAGIPAKSAPSGTWAGTPLVNGSHAARVSSIAMDGFTPGATVKAGDLFQVGSGLTTHLHKVVKDATADGSGELTLEIWPSLRATLANNTALVTSSPQGIWRLAPGTQVNWSIAGATLYGLSFSAIEAQ